MICGNKASPFFNETRPFSPNLCLIRCSLSLIFSLSCFHISGWTQICNQPSPETSFGLKFSSIQPEHHATCLPLTWVGIKFLIFDQLVQKLMTLWHWHTLRLHLSLSFFPFFPLFDKAYYLFKQHRGNCYECEQRPPFQHLTALPSHEDINMSNAVKKESA